MVVLKFIHTTKCPVCGCTTVVSESVETETGRPEVRTHTNGGVWESRQFACGYRVDYIPNYYKERVGRPCSVDPVVLEEKRKNTAAKCAVLEYIIGLDCSEAFKTQLSNSIAYL